MLLTQLVDEYLAHPRVGLKTVIIGDGSLQRIRSVVRDLAHDAEIAVLSDDSEFQDAHGAVVKVEVETLLQGLGATTWVTLPGPVRADEETIAAAADACSNAHVVVTVGSGTLADIGKAVAGSRSHLVVQTAASVNGFADDHSVLLSNGVKRTTVTAWPTALIIDGAVLAGAPAALNRSGLGDLTSMFTAPADWYLSHVFGMDRGWSPAVAAMARQHAPTLLSAAGGIGRNDPAALMVLAELLTVSGLSMGVAGHTAPSSGMEHTVSHLLDMVQSAKGLPTSHHGAQVGVATVVTAVLWRRMMSAIARGDVSALTLPSSEEAERTVRAAFDRLDPTGAASDECWHDYSRKLAHLSSTGASKAFDDLLRTWDDHRAVLDDLVESPERIAGALAEATAPVNFTQLDTPVDREDAEWALLNCHLMRDRFTIADLAFLTGHWGIEDVRSALLEAETMGGGL